MQFQCPKCKAILDSNEVSEGENEGSEFIDTVEFIQ